jgi:hypothetical protein
MFFITFQHTLCQLQTGVFCLVPSAMRLGRAFKKYVLASVHVTQNVQLEQQQPMPTHICSDQLLAITVQSDV